MKQLELLEQELKMVQENIQRIKEYQKDEQNKAYKPYNSHVVGELKHRLTALKQRITLVNGITTSDLWR
jgi:predicted nuclease with TOPRIM domain